MKTAGFFTALFFLVILVSCNTLKTGKKERNQTLSELQTKEISVQTQAESTTSIWFEHKLASEYAVQITPVGTFSFSPENGFQGMANSVTMLRKNQQTFSEAKNVSNAQTQAKVVLEKQKLKLKTSSRQVEKTRFSLWFLLLLIPILFLILYWLCRKKFTRNGILSILKFQALT